MTPIIEVYSYTPIEEPRWSDVRLAVWLFNRPLLCIYHTYWTAELFGRSFVFQRKVRWWARGR